MPKKKAAPAKEKAPAAKKNSVPEQGFIFGEADMILNALETEKSELNKACNKCIASIGRLCTKRDDLAERANKLQEAIAAARKHAPMKEDPAPPEETDEALAPPEDPTEPQEEAESTIEGDKSLFREAIGPTVPELLKLGDIIETNWGAGSFRIEEIQGPFNSAKIPLGKGETAEVINTPDYYTLKCSELDADRTKEGKLKRGAEITTIGYIVGVARSLVNIFTASSDSIVLALPKGEGSGSFKKVSAGKEDKKEGFF